jgi:hypothetical protein
MMASIQMSATASRKERENRVRIRADVSGEINIQAIGRN